MQSKRISQTCIISKYENAGYTDAVKIENQEKKGAAVTADLVTEEEYTELTICVRFMFTMFLTEE